MLELAQYQDGRLELQEVAEPQAPPGGILVRTTCSVISPGTEKMKVEQARMSLLQKAKARPDQVKKVIDTARTLGWKAAMEKVKNRLESPTPLGYSAAGVVVAVDALNTRFKVGDRVACGGAECAFHAEMIAVPDLLAARVPEGVEDWQAAYTTLASISLQAVRQAEVRLGDRVLVVGQGLVGQLATSLLKASGARVMAVDFLRQRLAVSEAMGAERVVNPAETKVEDAVREWTEGVGVDAVLLCVGGKGSEAAEMAISCLRDRGTMVIVGIYDAELSWKTAYMKDIQVRYSRSYGPGRYDAGYEWGGKDYPVGYVRWTENRNFEACLHLMKTGALDLGPVTTRRARFEDAVGVYDELMRAGNGDVGVVMGYGESSTGVPPVVITGAGGTATDLNADETPALRNAGGTPAGPGTGGTPVVLREERVFVAYDPLKRTDRTRRNLPHWEQTGVTQFVTFRQADSIPQSLLEQWTQERDRWLNDHPRPWDLETEEMYFRLFQERKEAWLDQGMGSCILAQADAAAIVQTALLHFDGSRYVLDAYVIMPNHVHVLLKPLEGHGLSDILHSWKSFTSHEIKKRYGLGSEPFWQEESFDHALRNVQSLESKREYIQSNSERAKLTKGFVAGWGVGILNAPEERSGQRDRKDNLAEGVTALLCAGETSLLQTARETPAVRDTGGTPVVHVIGAGNFARTMLLPHLKGAIPLGTIVNGTGLSARHVREKFGFAEAETDAGKIWEKKDGGAVMVGTRHHLHAPLVLEGLRRERHVFVEKPLCLTVEELAEIDGVMTQSQGSVMVGFNRRFAPATVELRKVLEAIPGPKTLAYHVFAGPLAPDHWYANLEESGGRVLGEACHFFDYACFLLGKPVQVTAQTVGRPRFADSVTAQIEFENGSSAQIIYSAEGDFGFPKETFRVFGSGVVAECENFQQLTLYRKRKRAVRKFNSKGHAEEMAAWLAFLKDGGAHPLPYEEARRSMRLTFAVLESVREGRSVEVR